MKNTIEKTIDFVKDFFEDDVSGHDWWHTQRVCRAAQYICDKEKADAFIVEMAALLHDVDDHKFSNEAEEKDKLKTRRWLEALEIDRTIVNKIIDAITTVSFKGANLNGEPGTLEAKIVQDADRLDALGAIGIARTFACGANFKRPIYDPNQKPGNYKTKKEYYGRDTTSINHFYEKILLLKDTMNTKTARDIAHKRHNIVEKYLKEFMNEWDSKDLIK